MPCRTQRIAAVSFDADGTLWDYERTMRHALACALEEIGRRVPAAVGRLSVEAMIDIRNRAAEELRSQSLCLEAIRLEAFRRTLAYVGSHDGHLAEHVNAVYMKHRFEDSVLYDDVLPALDALRGRCVLGILSNGNSHPDRCGLGGRFDFVVFAQDHGIEKPDPRLFAIALHQAGCAREQMLHVGDSLYDDVFGAQRAGLRSVWLNRLGKRNETGIRPDHEVSSLQELVSIRVRCWRNPAG